MIVGGAGKVTGAMALAAISGPLCAAGIGVAGEIAAGIVAASGGGDIAQGIQEIMYGWNGDSESESFNLVRDTLYCGNEEAYQISTGIAAASADLGKLLEVGLTKIAAKKAAKSAAKEAAEVVAKDAAETVAKEAVESATKGAGGLIDEAVEATAKEAAESAIKKGVKQGTKDAIEDVAENSVDDLLKNTEDFYDDIFDPYYKEQFNPIGEEAIGNPDGIEGISKSGSTSKYLEQLDNLSENKINHMIDGSKNSNHGWEKLVPDKNWSDIKNIIADVMDTGVEGPYKSVFSKKVTINGFEVEVTYTKLSDGTIKISDAWVNQ